MDLVTILFTLVFSQGMPQRGKGDAGRHRGMPHGSRCLLLSVNGFPLVE